MKVKFIILLITMFFMSGCSTFLDSYIQPSTYTSKNVIRKKTEKKNSINLKYRNLDFNKLIADANNDTLKILKLFHDYLLCKFCKEPTVNAPHKEREKYIQCTFKHQQEIPSCLASRGSDYKTIRKVLFYVEGKIDGLNDKEKSEAYKEIAYLYSQLNDDINQKRFMLKALSIDEKYCSNFNYAIKGEVFNNYCLSYNMTLDSVDALNTNYDFKNKIPLLYDYITLSHITRGTESIRYDKKALAIIKQFSPLKHILNYNKLANREKNSVKKMKYYDFRNLYYSLLTKEISLYLDLAYKYDRLKNYDKALAYLDKYYDIGKYFYNLSGEGYDYKNQAYIYKLDYYLRKAYLLKDFDKTQSVKYFLKYYKTSKDYEIFKKQSEISKIKKEYSKKIKQIKKCEKRKNKKTHGLLSPEDFECAFLNIKNYNQAINVYENEMRKKIDVVNNNYRFINQCQKGNFYYPCVKTYQGLMSYLDFFKIYDYTQKVKFLINLENYIEKNKLYYKDFGSFALNNRVEMLIKFGKYFFDTNDSTLAYKYLLKASEYAGDSEGYLFDGDYFYMLGVSAQEEGFYADAFEYYKQALKEYNQNFLLYPVEKQRKIKTKIKKILGFMVDDAVEAHKRYLDPSRLLLKYALDYSLNYKDELFETETFLMKTYYTTGNENLKSEIKEYFQLKRHLSTMLLAEKKDIQKINNIKLKIKSLYNDLILKTGNPFTFLSYEKLQTKLDNGVLFINIIKSGSKYYIFYFDNNFLGWNIFSGQREIILENSVREYLKLINNSIYQRDIKSIRRMNVLSSKIYGMVFGFLKNDKNMPLSKYKKIIISPDGILRLLPFGALIDKDKRKYLIEEKEIVYVPSAKFIVNPEKTVIKKMEVFADPVFDANVKLPVSTRSVEKILDSGNLLRDLTFTPLPGTLKEAEVLNKIGKKFGIPLKEYIKVKANVYNLLRVKSPSILHIATHGFFVNDKDILNPMLRSGIALSGANENKINGIVTALRISGIDLSNTNLVVLSACDTAKLDANSTDSISALNKSFLMAGAENVISTLWEINDKATVEFMKEFYKAYLRSHNVSSSLRKVKTEFIKNRKPISIWAPFIVYGGAGE